MIFPSRKSAEKKLCELSAVEDRSVYDKLSKQDYLSLLPFIGEANNYANNITLRIAVKKFLYYGTLAFDKFNVGVFVVTADDFDNYKTFLDKLWEHEGEESGNAPSRELSLIRWELYHNFAINSESRDLDVDLKEYENDINDCNVTDYYADKKEEIAESKSKLFKLIDGFRNNTIKTKFSFRLPSLFADRNSIVSFKIKDIDVKVVIKSLPMPAGDKFFSIGGESQAAIVENNGATRWQNGITEVELTLNALFDDSYFAIPLMLDEDMTPNNSWNSLYSFTFEVIEKLWFYLRAKNRAIYNHYPSPKDIPFIKYEVFNNEDSIDWKLSSNPSYRVKVSSIPEEVEVYDDFDFYTEAKWFDKCYEYSTIYVELGQFKEALFWLNASTESMVWEFAKSVLGSDTFECLAKGSPAYERAETILSEQFPDMAQKVDWGDATRVTAIYQLIERVVKEGELQSKLKYRLLNKYYSHISEFRNDLVHGKKCDVTASIMQKALSAYTNLREAISPYIK